MPAENWIMIEELTKLTQCTEGGMEAMGNSIIDKMTERVWMS